MARYWEGVNYVGANFSNYDSMLVLSHFKGHAMAGFGGSLKNISIGIASSMGKVWIHSGGETTQEALWLIPTNSKWQWRKQDSPFQMRLAKVKTLFIST